ncbi:hypothetical protein [Chryseobacterium chendengshani]|uniref:hypothetical protein n=1 Tax=Chryseobacterium sp. LJ756 TaxID=2864113 RepID=UPI001C643BC3|nr:hypothetical protein [Chryseobacterium sp. LJ756]MBW7675228.1 hypothetical protein [Chryseobacterium sp. LJ756]
MKNLFKFACILSLLITGFAFGQDLNALKKDQTFIDYLKKEIEVINKVNPEDIIKIRSVIDDKVISENEKEDLSKYLGFENFEGYSVFLMEQHVALRKLQADYSLEGIDPNVLATEVIASPEIYPIIDTSPQTFGDECSKSCVKTNRNCLVKTTALAVVSHIGCAAIDSFGVGLLCHAAVQAAAIAELSECDNQQGVCLRGCK